MSTTPTAPPHTPDDEEKKGAGLPAGAPDGLKAAAASEPLPDGEEGAKQEAGALDFLCGDSPPVPFTVKAKLETKQGQREATFHMIQVDGSRIDALEQEHRRTEEGPLFGTVDVFALNCAIIAEATQYIEEPGGRKVEPTDSSFIGGAVAPRFAFERAFRFQPGIANMVAAEVRRMAGLQEDLVSRAERVMTSAVGNS